MSKLRLNTEWLCACGGCHVGIVDLHEKLLDILGAVDILHCPVLTDIKDRPEAELGIITGAVRNEHDREAALDMRAKCKSIIAFGTCAVYGGLSAASLAHSREEILDSVYVNNRTTRGKPPSKKVSPLEHQVLPVDEVIDVDLYLPGCPPHASYIFDALLSLVKGRPVKAGDENVCARCKREMTITETQNLATLNEYVPDNEVCFLSQGTVCLGSVTLDRCLAPCPRKGVPCSGCAGPTMQVLTEPNRDIRTEVAERMASMTNIKHETIVKAMEQSAKTHYAYAMATRMVGEKPTFQIKKWIENVERG